MALQRNNSRQNESWGKRTEHISQNNAASWLTPGGWCPWGVSDLREWSAAAAIARAGLCSLQASHAACQFEGSRARSGRRAAGMILSTVVA
jgi:hypothetical protein